MRNHLSNEDKNLLIGLKTEMENQYSGIAPKMDGMFRATTKPLGLKEDEESVQTPGTATMQSATACILDAYVCPDGSTVGRVPPDCNFASCPPVTDQAPGPSLADYVPSTQPTNGDIGIDTGPGSGGGGGGGGATDPSGTDKVVPKRKNWKWILLILALIAIVWYATNDKKKIKIFK